MAPNLSITYNSYQGNGWIGVGFLLDMGAIQRSSKTPGGLRDNSSDLFVATANGSVSKLVPRTDPAWGGAGHHQNQIDGAFLNYYFNASAGGAAGSWQVKDKNGTVYYYGSRANSQLANYYGVFEWLLDRVQDVNGNYMSVTYWQDSANNQVYLQR